MPAFYEPTLWILQYLLHHIRRL